MKKYHIELKFGEKRHLGWNLSDQEILEDFLLPFVNGQVVFVKRASGNRLLNMKSVTSLIIYETNHNLATPSEAIHPTEFDDLEFLKNQCTEDLVNEIKKYRANPAITSLLQKSFARPEKKVFVIMKYGEDALELAYVKAIRPVIEEYEFKCIRIDEIEDSGKISDQILDQIATSAFILSDLSGGRPNCYYETGFASALGKELILTVREEENIHFDLKGHRFIIWKNVGDLEAQLRKRMVELSKRKHAKFWFPVAE